MSAMTLSFMTLSFMTMTLSFRVMLPRTSDTVKRGVKHDEIHHPADGQARADKLNKRNKRDARRQPPGRSVVRLSTAQPSPAGLFTLRASRTDGRRCDISGRGLSDADERTGQGVGLYGAPAGQTGHALTKFSTSAVGFQRPTP
jgi:hypothetical protein